MIIIVTSMAGCWQRVLSTHQRLRRARGQLHSTVLIHTAVSARLFHANQYNLYWPKMKQKDATYEMPHPTME